METSFYRYAIVILLTVTWTAHLADGKSPLIQKPITEQDERLLFAPQNKETLADVDLFEIADDNHVAVPGKGIQYVPWWVTFLMDIIMNFYRQRENNRSQFGVLFMGNVDNLNNFPLNFQPQNQNGDPVLDNRYAISPNNVADFGNYVSTRPENVAGTMIHSEARILYNLDSLWNAYLNQNGRTPNFMLLYSWIMPCPNCTDMILSRFNLQPYSNVQYRVVAYTVEGTNSGLPYMTPQSNAQSRNNLKNSGITVYRQRCQRPNDTVSNIRIESADEISEDANVEKTIVSQMKDNPNTHVCRLEDTFQGCLVDCLGDICCSCKTAGKRAMTIALVNELTKFCATSDISTCPLEWMNTYFSGNQNSASSCTVFESVAEKVRKCAATTCFGRPMSKPLDPRYPYYNPGYLINFSDLNTIPKVDLTDLCQDIRAESLLCTPYRADSFTAVTTDVAIKDPHTVGAMWTSITTGTIAARALVDSMKIQITCGVEVVTIGSTVEMAVMLPLITNDVWRSFHVACTKKTAGKATTGVIQTHSTGTTAVSLQTSALLMDIATTGATLATKRKQAINIAHRRKNIENWATEFLKRPFWQI